MAKKRTDNRKVIKELTTALLETKLLNNKLDQQIIDLKQNTNNLMAANKILTDKLVILEKNNEILLRINSQNLEQIDKKRTMLEGYIQLSKGYALCLTTIEETIRLEKAKIWEISGRLGALHGFKAIPTNPKDLQ